MPGKRVSKDIVQLVYFNHYKGKSHKEIAEMFPSILGQSTTLLTAPKKKKGLKQNIPLADQKR